MKLGSALLTAHLWLVLAFLYVPIVVMAVLGFNASPLYALPFEFDLVWYRELAGNDKLIDAGIHSVGIAIVNTIIATALGTMAALAFARYQFRGKTILQLLLFPPVAIPWLVIGTAMLVFFFWIDIKRGLFAILLGHVALSLPYVIVVVGARSGALFRRVVFPMSLPGVLAGSALIFVPAVGSFMEPRILGGAKGATLGMAVEEQFTVTANWPFGAALSFLMLGAVLLICLVLYPPARKRMEGL